MTEDTDALTRAWLDAEQHLPPGWALAGLRCASTGLAPEQRSDDWIAVAALDGGQERQFRALDPFAALEGLVRSFG